ncbi:T9SS type A sorting domain-containing protein [Neolewinella agarilytica]|uniref:T9SS type A sorting domain-containing protein n=1 Tax=Neolewinella agarilytica TaxID=478744 RepID=UPI002354F7AA|nr:T9SS type A sorting domain-containing protein [Neolewinella agarilytica]
MNCSNQMIGGVSGLLFLLLFSSNLISQTDSIDFTLCFYFENAIGERDTVNIFVTPFDTDSISPSLGEINLLNVPFDSSFDIRVGKGYSVSDPQIYIGDNIAASVTYRFGCIQYFGSFHFIIHNKYPPTKIYWDTEPWLNPDKFGCWGNPHLFNTRISDLVGDWWWSEWPKSGIETICLRQKGEFEFDPQKVPWRAVNHAAYYVGEVAGSSTEPDTFTVFRMEDGFVGVDGCQEIIDNVDDISSLREQVNIYPNPVTNRLQLSAVSDGLLVGARYDILTVEGKSLLSGTFTGESLDVAALPAGVYFLRLTRFNALVGGTRFIKL